MAESAAQRALRLLDLVPYLTAHPGVKLNEVAAEFGITRKELVKDLNLLFICGLPGYTDLELIDLSYEDDVVIVRQPQVLNAPRVFSEQEALIIRIALATLEDALPESERERIAALRRKLASIFRSEIPDSAISFRGAKEQEFLRLVERAIKEDRRIEISYLNPARDQKSLRTISPIRVDLSRNRTLIDAWCDLADGIRTFNLVNIESVTLTDIPRRKSNKEQTSSSYLARFSGPKTAWFIRENEENLTPMGSGDFEIEIFQEEWLIRSVLASAGEIEVLEPKPVAERIRGTAQKALRNYL